MDPPGCSVKVATHLTASSNMIRAQRHVNLSCDYKGRIWWMDAVKRNICICKFYINWAWERVWILHILRCCITPNIVKLSLMGTWVHVDPWPARGTSDAKSILLDSQGQGHCSNEPRPHKQFVLVMIWNQCIGFTAPQSLIWPRPFWHKFWKVKQKSIAPFLTPVWLPPIFFFQFYWSWFKRVTWSKS